MRSSAQRGISLPSSDKTVLRLTAIEDTEQQEDVAA
jgi:hypothetical protein